MALGKVPLRLSMGGGGTDIASFYKLKGGFWTSAAMSLYVRITINCRWDNLWVVKFSDRTQRVTDISEIQHPILRESLKFMKAPDWLKGKGLEMNIISDVPSKSGLGVSGAITVNLLQILHTMKGDGFSLQQLAEEAYHVEHDLCGSSATGKQDQYIAAIGGITSFEVTRSGHVDVLSLNLESRTRLELNENLVLFGTGTIREKTAEETLKEQGLAEQKLSREKVAYFERIKEIGLAQREAMLSGKIRRFGELLDEHWKVKKSYSNHTANSAIDDIYEVAKQAGAIGGKVVGAGTVGAFWLFYVEADKKSALRDAMAAYNLQEVPWSFVDHGSMISYCE
ncbi:MAG: galactokinase [Candidatus Moranbacteria bacterium]|nr:galactokinase [Candidatus Moranbacteria bacterium]